MEEISWTQEHMLEVGLNEPDDFLKVRETLSRNFSMGRSLF